MPPIRVDPTDLREVARRFSAASSALGELCTRLSHSWDELDIGNWEGAHRYLVAGNWLEAQAEARRLTDQAEILSALMIGKANRFEQADCVSLASVGHMFGVLSGARGGLANVSPALRPGFDRARVLAGRMMVLPEGCQEVPVTPVASLRTISGKLSGARDIQ